MANGIKNRAPEKGERFFVEYDPKFCDMLIEHMALGYSFASFGGVINIGKTTLYAWVSRYPEFSESKDIGYNRGLLFIEQHYFSKLTGHSRGQGIIPKYIDSGSLYFVLKTRFHEVYFEPKEQPKEAEDNAVNITYELKKPE